MAPISLHLSSNVDCQIDPAPGVDSFSNIASTADGQRWSISHALQCGPEQVRYISSRRLFK